MQLVVSVIFIVALAAVGWRFVKVFGDSVKRRGLNLLMASSSISYLLMVGEMVGSIANGIWLSIDRCSEREFTNDQEVSDW